MNGSLDHTNYEAWLLDRSEGSLTPQQERELDAFLAMHPHLAPDDLALPSVTVNAAELGALDKEALKRSIPPVGLVGMSTVEDHLIARLEGDLDRQQQDALRAYLIAHPEWQQADRTFALTKLVPEAIAFAAKRDLERHYPPLGRPTVQTLDDHLIARLEGDLSATQEQVLDRFLRQDVALERNWTLMKATRIEATPVRFVGKEGLKKREGRVIPIAFGSWYGRMAAAASVAALIAVGLWYLRSPDGVEERIARVPVTTTDSIAKEGSAQEHAQPITDAEQHSGSDTSVGKPVVPRDQRGPVATDEHPEERSAPSRERPVQLPVESTRNEKDPLIAEEPVPTKEQPVLLDPSRSTAQEPEQLAEVIAPAERSAAISTSNERTLSDMFTSALRERVLDTPERSATPLDGDDAMAAVDRTLKVVGGAHAGLDLERKAKGGINGFNLRLGRNLSISASR